MDGVLERLLRPRQTATEYWLATFPTHEVRMNESGLFANAGDILVTNGFNGCTALIVRAELPDGQVKGFLAHKHADPNRVDEFVTDFEHGQLPTDTKLYGTILYAGDEYGRTLGHESEALQLALQSRLRERFCTQWHKLRSVRYAIYSGFPTSVNSNSCLQYSSKYMGTERRSI